MPDPCTEMNLIQFGRTYLLSALDRCTPEALDFRPPAVELPEDYSLFSIREHFLHIADIGEMFIHEAVLDEHKPRGSWRVIYEDAGSFRLGGSFPDAASIRAELERCWDFQDRHLLSRPQKALGDAIGHRGRSLAEELGWLVFHESQHRGQILTLMRMAGLEPPRW
ncbi:DinB family protein [bacterium]|nr:DinB family protein [bacterium]